MTLPGHLDLPTAGIERPREKIIQLLKDVPFSKMLGREFFLSCEDCASRAARLKPREGSRHSRATGFAWLAGYLLAPEAAHIMGRPVNAVELATEAVRAYEEVQRASAGIQELRRLGRSPVLGSAIDITRETITAERGHLLIAGGRRLRLAHIRETRADAAAQILRIIEHARCKGHSILAVAETETFDGEVLTHLIVPQEQTYVNLRMVEEGFAAAYKHREPLRTSKVYTLMLLAETSVP